MGQNIESTRHWIKQRISSILLVPLTVLFIYNFLNVAFLPYNEVITNYDNIFNLIIAFLFITISIWHFYQGIEVVLEDYIHNIYKRSNSKNIEILMLDISYISLSIIHNTLSLLKLGET